MYSGPVVRKSHDHEIRRNAGPEANRGITILRQLLPRLGRLYIIAAQASHLPTRLQTVRYPMNAASTPRSITINGRRYKWPDKPVVIVCVDGSEPDYIEQAIKAGAMPWMQRMLSNGGTEFRAECVMPSFTNPNNMSIATGVPPSEHGICGNFYYDRETDREVMMNEPDLLRKPTIFKAFQDAGARIAIVTAKDKLRRLLGHGLTMHSGDAVCFSSEKADKVTMAENGVDDVLGMVGMEVPSVYSAELSEFLFKAGAELLKNWQPDIMYLSTTDYIQHKFPPGSSGANAFYAMMDSYCSELHERDPILGLTADHGMNAKHDEAGNPNVVYLQDMIDTLLGTDMARVILPITDPYVAHHGALGSFATVYLNRITDMPGLVRSLSDVSGMEMVLTNDEACRRFSLAPDRVGDLVLISGKHTVIGTSADRHDLSGLDAPLRSHGGISEQIVPIIFNCRIEGVENRILKNFDILDLALNHASS